MDPTPANLQVFFTGLKNLFYAAYGGVPAWWNTIAMEVPSDTELETYGWMDRLPIMEEWIGPRKRNSVPTRARVVTNRDWSEVSAIPRNKFLDDKLGLFTPIAEEMGRQAAKLHDQQLVKIMQSTASTQTGPAVTGNPTCFDGVTFFNTTHPVDVDAGTGGPFGSYSNDLATNALNASNFATAVKQMENFTGRDGQPLNINPTHLVVPPALREAATVITKAEMIAPQTFGNMTTNVGATSNIWKGFVEVLVIRELANQPNVWYLIDASRGVKPFLVQNRQAPNFVYLVNPNDPNVFWQKEYVWGADSRSAYDVTLPFLALRNGISI
jgi:phage major head subunit gpT-like protein